MMLNLVTQLKGIFNSLTMIFSVAEDILLASVSKILGEAKIIFDAFCDDIFEDEFSISSLT